MRPTIAGVTRVRNEAHLIQDTLDYYSETCNHGIFALDEASTDATPEILIASPDVRKLIQVPKFETDPGKRRAFEGWGRQQPYDQAVAAGAEWVLYFDADERIEFDFDSFDYDAWDAVSFRLFDFYITEEDEHLSYDQRKWIGPEYRDIPMLFRVQSVNRFQDRVPFLVAGARVHTAGYSGVVRHYGKAISEVEWEKTCCYYSEFQPEPFKSKWEERKGKCVRRSKPYMSDFGRALCPWDTREEYGTPIRNGSNLSLAETTFHQVLSWGSGPRPQE